MELPSKSGRRICGVRIVGRRDLYTGKNMQRAIVIGIGVVVILVLLVYAGDYCSVRYQIPGGRPQFGQVQMNVMYVIHVKAGKIQYEPGPLETDTCVHSLFPQMGYSPCWYLSRHSDKLIDI